MDTAKPSSDIEKILPYWQNTLSFTININATDYTSNVKNVTLWHRYSPDNSSWNNWTVYNVDPESPWSILFTGNNGYYQFYSVAADFAGNKEDAPETPDLIIGTDTGKPTADAGNPQTVNQNTVVTFNSSGSSDAISGISSYVWTFTDENLQTLSGKQPQYTFDNADEFLVTLNVTDRAGNWDTDTITIIVKDSTPPTIIHTAELVNIAPGQPVEISVNITDNVGIVSVILYYRSTEEASWKSLSMKQKGGNTWVTTIPGKDVTNDTYYYFFVTDVNGNNATKPENGKQNPYLMSVRLDAEGEEEEGAGIQGWIIGLVAAIIATVGLLGFVYYKKKLKEIKPSEKGVKDKPKIKPRKVKYNRGSCYMIREQTPETSFKVFSDFVKKGAPGLCVTRTNPDEVKEKHKLKNVELLWLTTGREDEHSINPTHIEKMTWTIKEFIKNNRNSAVLLDGVEYLIVQNNFLTILKSLQALEDTVSINKSILIIPISPMAISEKEMSYLERDFVVV